VLPVAAILIAGCGGERSNVSGGVDQVNTELAKQGAKLDCPKEVDGGEGAKFDCTLKGTQTGKSTKVKMKIVKSGGSLAVDFNGSAAEVQAAIKQVTA
jgi:N-methylhydantoinase B/oxoprolinase/acetone carboxylase alpha subunit